MLLFNSENYNINTRLAEGAESLKTPVPEATESRPVQIPTEPPDSAETLAEWGFLLAEALSLAPWNHEASLWVDRAITSLEERKA